MNTRRRCCRSSAPTTAPTVSDLCVGIDRRRKCRSKKAKRWLGCKWSGACAVKHADFIQPIPLECGGTACCELNKRACKGTGVHARKWAKKQGMNPKKVCKYTKDKSMQNKTPDGKCDQELNLMGAHKPNIEHPFCVLSVGHLFAQHAKLFYPSQPHTGKHYGLCMQK